MLAACACTFRRRLCLCVCRSSVDLENPHKKREETATKTYHYHHQKVNVCLLLLVCREQSRIAHILCGLKYIIFVLLGTSPTMNSPPSIFMWPQEEVIPNRRPLLSICACVFVVYMFVHFIPTNCENWEWPSILCGCFNTPFENSAKPTWAGIKISRESLFSIS